MLHIIHPNVEPALIMMTMSYQKANTDLIMSSTFLTILIFLSPLSSLSVQVQLSES